MEFSIYTRGWATTPTIVTRGGGVSHLRAVDVDTGRAREMIGGWLKFNDSRGYFDLRELAFIL